MAMAIGDAKTAAERDAPFSTISGEPIKPLYTEPTFRPTPRNRSGFRASIPYTRGVYGSMYRGRLWTMRQFAGFGDGGGDQPALPLPARSRPDRALDGVRHAVADGPRLRSSPVAGRGGPRGCRDRLAGRHGDAVRRDPARRGERVDDDQRAGGDHARVLRRRGGAARACRPTASAGTIQTDILKEYIAQKEWCFPVDPAMRLVTDMIEWCSEQMPRWHPISISGYHIREAGSTAAQELAFTLKDGLTYVEHAIARGLDVDDFAPRLSASSSTPTSTSSRRSPSTAPRGGSGPGSCATPSARSRRALAADALSHPDGGRLADRAAAAQQHRAHRDRGARRGSRRHAVAAHELLRRGACAARPSRRSESRCEPSRSSPRRPVSRTRSIRSAAPTSSRR